MPKKKTLGQRITAGRKKLGLNRHQLAKAAGLDHKHIDELERGEYRAKIITLRKLAEALSCDWRDLVD